MHGAGFGDESATALASGSGGKRSTVSREPSKGVQMGFTGEASFKLGPLELVHETGICQFLL